MKVGSKVQINLDYIKEKNRASDIMAVTKFMEHVSGEDYLLITDVLENEQNPYIVNDYMGFSKEELILVN